MDTKATAYQLIADFDATLAAFLAGNATVADLDAAAEAAEAAIKTAVGDIDTAIDALLESRFPLDRVGGCASLNTSEQFKER